MFASVLIILCSLGLLAFWLRWACLLVLKESAQGKTDYPLFNFPALRGNLGAGECDASVKALLDRDYAALAYLIRRAPVGVEARLLAWDYRLMRCWHLITRRQAALREMAQVVASLAEKLAKTAPEPVC